LFTANFDGWYFGNYVVGLTPSSPKTAPTTPPSNLCSKSLIQALTFACPDIDEVIKHRALQLAPFPLTSRESINLEWERGTKQNKNALERQE
jgi:hypothetical protein